MYKMSREETYKISVVINAINEKGGRVRKWKMKEGRSCIRVTRKGFFPQVVFGNGKEWLDCNII